MITTRSRRRRRQIAAFVNTPAMHTWPQQLTPGGPVHCLLWSLGWNVCFGRGRTRSLFRPVSLEVSCSSLLVEEISVPFQDREKNRVCAYSLSWVNVKTQKPNCVKSAFSFKIQCCYCFLGLYFYSRKCSFHFNHLISTLQARCFQILADIPSPCTGFCLFEV